MRRLLKIILGFFGLISFSIVLSFLGAGLWTQVYGKSWLENKIKHQFNLDVSIQHLTSNFFNTLSAEKISIQNPYQVSIEHAQLSFRPWDLFNPHRKFKNVFSLSLVGVDTHLELPQGKSDLPRTPSVTSRGPITLPITILLSESSLETTYHGEKFTVSQVEGEIRPERKLWDVHLKGDAHSLGQWEAKAQWDSEQNRSVLNFRTHNLSLETLASKMGEKWKPQYGKVEGLAEASLSFTNSHTWKGELSGSNLTWKKDQSAVPIPLSAKFSVHPTSIIIDHISVPGIAQISGTINQPWTQPELNLNVTGNNIPLKQVALLLSHPEFQDDNLGKIDISAHVNGTADNPNLSAEFSSLPQFDQVLFPAMNGKINYSNRVLNMDSDFAGGHIHSVLSLEDIQKINGTLELQKISLMEMAVKNDWQNVSGTFSADILIGKDSSLSGPFRVERLGWGRHKIEKTIEGNLNFTQRQFVIQTKDDQLAIRANFPGKEIRVEKFKIEFSSNSAASGSGVIDTRLNLINCSIQAQNLPPDLWPPLVASYPDISGGMDLEGTFYGTQQAPQVKLDVVFHSLKFIPQGQAWNGSANLAWDGQEMTLRNVRLDGGYSGEVRFSKAKPTPLWSFNLNLDNADPHLFTDLSKSALSVGGGLSGHLNSTIQASSLVGDSSVTWKNGKIGSIDFDSAEVSIKMDQQSIKLTDLTLTRQDQALKGNAELIRKGVGEWDYEALLQAQQVGTQNLNVDGEIHSSGSFNWPSKNIRGSIESSIVYLNGTPLEDFKMKYEKVGQWITLSGESKPYLEFSARVGLNSDVVKAKLKGHSLNIGEIYKKYYTTLGLAGFPSGTGELELAVAGHWDDPQIEAHIKIPKTTWRDETFFTEAYCQMTRSTLTITSSKLIFEKGGEIFADGSINLQEPFGMNIVGAGSDLNLRSLFHLIHWRLNWDGKTNTKFFITGEKDKRRVEFVFEGSHDGLSPFSGKGPVSGQAVWSKGEWDLNGITVNAGDGYVKLLKGSRAIINKNDTGILRVIADVRNLRAGIMTFFGAVELTGTWVEPKPTSDEKNLPTVVDLDVFARSLWVNQILLNGNITHLTIDRNHLQFSPITTSEQQISGVLNYEDKEDLTAKDVRLLDGGEERFYLNGQIGNKGWNFHTRAKEVDAHFIQALFDTNFPVSGPMELDISGKGSMENPVLHGSLAWKNGQFGELPVDNASCDLHLKDGVLRISNLLATRKRGYQLKGSVVSAFPPDRDEPKSPTTVDVKIEKGDFALLKEMWPSVTKAKGAFEGEIKYDKSLQGYFTLENISLQTDSYIPKLKDGKLQLTIEGDTVTVVSGTARLNDGKIQLTGSLQLNEGEPSFYSLRLNTLSEEGPSIRVPDLTIPPGAVLGHFRLLNQKLGGVTRGDPIINVSLVGAGDRPVLAGEVILENTIFTFPGAPSKNKMEHAAEGLARWWHNFLHQLSYNLLLKTGKRTRYENDYVSTTVSGSLTLQGPSNDLVINGKMDSGQGSIVYGGNEFKLNEAQLEVVTPKPVQNEPSKTFVYLKANAERDVYYTDARGNGNQDTIVMEVDRSLVGEIQPRFYSRTNPNISPERAVKLALGIDLPSSNIESAFGPTTKTNPTNSAVDVNQAMRVGLVQLLDSNLASPMARALARETGLVDYIRVTYQDQKYSPDVVNQAQSQNLTSPSVTQNEWWRYMKGTKIKFGKGLSNRLFADYSFKVDEYQNQVDLRHEVELALRLHKNLFIRATSELDSQQTLGRPPDRRALLENQWRFGLPKKKGDSIAPAGPTPTPSGQLPPKG